MAEKSFRSEAWKLFREQTNPTLQDLFALRPRPRPKSKLDKATVEALISWILESAPTRERQRIIQNWIHGQGR